MPCKAMGSTTASQPFDIASITVCCDGVERERHPLFVVRHLMEKLSASPVAVVDELERSLAGLSDKVAECKRAV
jgi:hypothetical protein